MSFTEEAYSMRRHAKPKAKRVLITGAKGSLGSLLAARLTDQHVTATDVDTLDVTRWPAPDREHVGNREYDVVFHLAGAKHAPVGETDPEETFRVNAVGTANVIRAFPDAKVILASTCKACNPETVYGASKLIAERMVLNAGGVVVRYYNVRETQGNVFRHWESLPASGPIPYTDCWRYFITTQQAVDLTLAALDLPSGRYTVDPGESSHMLAEARSLYPGRPIVSIARRQGDRYREPLHAAHEHLVPAASHPGIYEIVSPHDFSSDNDLWAEWFEGRAAA